MRILAVIAVLLFGHIGVFSQTPDRTAEIEQVRVIIANLAAKRSSAEFILRDLSELKGKITAPTEDSFTLKTKFRGKKFKVRVLYREVLEIKSKNISVSFIPDPSTRPFGAWDDIQKIGYNQSVEIILENGQSVSGRLGEITNDKLVLLNHTGDEKLELPRSRIVYVYRVKYQSAKTGGSVNDGANKGRRIGQEIGPTPFGQALGAGLGTVVGAVAGVVARSAKKDEGVLYLLIFSK
jgi:hypothetical protein